MPNRDNLILTRTLKGDNCFNSISKIKTYCREKKYDDVWIIGGEAIYRQFIGNADLYNIYVTTIDADIKCDAFFPKIPPWFQLSWESEHFTRNDLSFHYQIYFRPDKEIGGRV